MRPTIIILLFITSLIIFCPSSSHLTKFTSSSPPPVITGYYPHYHSPLPAGHPLLRKTLSLRKDIEAHESLLRELVRHRYPVKSPLEFHFSYAGIDSLHQHLILRYFAPNPQADEIAGWQVQFVYQLPSLTIKSAYIWAVPLE